MTKRSAGLVALITGGARGIGVSSDDASFVSGQVLHVAGGPRG